MKGSHFWNPSKHHPVLERNTMSKSPATVSAAVLAAMSAVCVNGQPVSVKEVQNYMNLHTRAVKDTLGKLAAKGAIARVEAGVYVLPKAEHKKVTKMEIVLAFVNAANDEGRAPKISEISEKTGTNYGTTNQMLDQARRAGTLVRFNKGWSNPVKVIGITVAK
jgi:predicted transcriptional regulator